MTNDKGFGRMRPASSVQRPASSVQRPASSPLLRAYKINYCNHSVTHNYTTKKFFATTKTTNINSDINKSVHFFMGNSASSDCVLAFLYKCEVHYAFKVIKFPCAFCCSSVGKFNGGDRPLQSLLL